MCTLKMSIPCLVSVALGTLAAVLAVVGGRAFLSFYRCVSKTFPSTRGTSAFRTGQLTSSQGVNFYMRRVENLCFDYGLFQQVTHALYDGEGDTKVGH